MLQARYLTAFNKFLSIVLLLFLAFTFAQVLYAVTPNPGHDFSASGGGVVQGDLLYGSAADTLSALAKNITATRYLSNTGASNNPAWAQVDLTNGVTGTLPAGNGGTGNAFFTVSGPATSTKTFTFPNASSTVLTSNAAVTVSQGGTGAAPGADDQVLIADSTSAATWKAINDCTGAGKALTYTASSNTIGCNTISGSDPWTYLNVNSGSDFTTTSATAVNVTGLSLTPSANIKYEMECKLLLRTATTTVNPRVGFAWSTGLTDGTVWIKETQAATGAGLEAGGNPNAAVLIAVGGLPNTTQSWPAIVLASFAAGASPSGTTRVQLASETAGTTVTIKSVGSFCRYRTY